MKVATHLIVLLGSIASGLCGEDAPARPAYSWQQDATHLALRRGDQTIWQLVFDGKKPKSYFHPLATVEGNVLTGFEPTDHPWHRGLWWSWKFINGLNYWEENPQTGKSEGITELTDVTVRPGSDFTAHADLHLSYHPPGQSPVLTETRQLTISRPDEQGSYRIDWTSTFKAGPAPVKLDRTPLPHQGGPAYGGYAGLSLRLPPGLTGYHYRTSEGKTTAADGHGQPARWVDFSGPIAGIAIFDHPSNLRQPSPWYLSETPELMYFSPAMLFHEPLELAANQSLTLRYRVLVHSQPATAAQLASELKTFTAPSL